MANLGMVDDINVGVVQAFLQLKDDGFFDNLNKASSALESFEDSSNTGMSSLEKFSRTTGDWGTSLTRNVTTPAIRGFKSMIGAYEETESAFTGVKKTLNEEELREAFGLSKTQDLTVAYNALSDAIWQMTQETGSSYKAIAGVMEMAGQLNVPIGTAGKSIIDFTKNIIMLNDTTDLLGADAAKDLAQFTNIMHTSTDDFGNLGATIVDLGNNSATTEAAIVSMAMRLAGAGDSIGLTEAEVLAISATLNSVGISAEMGGSAFSKALTKMQTAAEVGYDPIIELQNKTGMSLRELELLSQNDSKSFTALADSLGMTKGELTKMINAGVSLNNFAKVANMTTEEFVDLWGKDAISAIEAFIIGLGDTETHGESTIQMLNDMGFTEVRLRDVLTRMSLAQGDFTRELDLANEAWGEGTALQDEANQRYQDLAVQITQLRSAWQHLEVDLAELFVPILRDIVEIVKELVNWLRSLPDWLQGILVHGAAILAILGPLLLALSGISGAIVNIKTFLDAFKGIGLIRKIKELVNFLGTGDAGLVGLITNLAKKIGGISLAIAGVVGFIATFIDAWKNGITIVHGLLLPLTGAIAGLGLMIAGLAGPWAIVVGAVIGAVAAIGIAIYQHWDELKEGWKKFWDGFFGSIKESIQGIIDFFKGIPAWIKEHITDPIKNALSDGFQAEDILTIGKALIDGLFNGILTAFKFLNPFYWLWNFIIKPIIDAVKALLGIESPSKVFAEIGGFIVEGLFQGISDTWQKIVEFFENAFKALGDWFRGMFSAIHDTVVSVWDTVSTALKTIFDNISGWFSDVWGFISGWFGDLISNISDFFGNIWETLSGWFNNFIQGVRDFFGNLIRDISEHFNNLRETIHNAFEAVSQVVQTVIETIKGAFETFVGFIQGAVENIRGIIENVISAIQGFIETAAEAIGTFFTNIFNSISELWENLTSFISDVFKKITSFLSEAFNNLWEWISGLPKKFLDIGKGIIESLWEGLKSVWTNVQNWFEEKFGWIQDLIEKIKGAASGIVDKVSSLLPGHANGLDYVPYDNYVARLHKGERVLTKSENEEYSRGSYSGGDTFNFYNTQPDPYEYSRQMKRAKKELLLS